MVLLLEVARYMDIPIHVNSLCYPFKIVSERNLFDDPILTEINAEFDLDTN